jgi:hypothetical protein
MVSDFLSKKIFGEKIEVVKILRYFRQSGITFYVAPTPVIRPPTTRSGEEGIAQDPIFFMYISIYRKIVRFYESTRQISLRLSHFRHEWHIPDHWQ